MIIESLGITFALLSGPLIILYLAFNPANSAYIGRSNKTLTSKSNQNKSILENEISFQKSPVVGGIQSSSFKGISNLKLKYAAKQVLTREDKGSTLAFAAGLNFIGELQIPIDTRDPGQTIKVVLPYGAKNKDSSCELPKGTVLLGLAAYSGQGEKVSIQFHQAVFPDGKSIKLSAIALDPKDYSPGLTAETQSQVKKRAISAMSLSVVAAMGNVLTEKESVGQFGVEPKATAKNAILSGLSKVSEAESSKMQESSQAQDFLQLEAGTVVMISLTQGFNL